MFIFDTAHIIRKEEGTYIAPCELCRKDTPHELTSIEFCVTALEQPVFPYRSRHLLVCRICGAGNELSRDEFQNFLKSNQKEEKPDPHLYKKSLAEGMKFCRMCGERIKQDAKFCNFCGEKIC